MSANNFCNLTFRNEPCGVILESIPSAVVVMEKPDGRVTYANARAIELHGQDPCGLIMESHASKLKIMTLDGQIAPMEQLHTYKALFKGETITNAPIMIERQDGKRFIVNVSATPIRNKKGDVYAAVAIFDDVTKQRDDEQKLKESEERYRTLVDNSPDSIVLHQSNQLIFANGAALNLFGAKTFDQVKGRSILDFVPTEAREKIIARIRGALVGQVAPLIEEELLRLDGTKIAAEVIAVPVSYGGQRAVQVILRDITERKRLEQQLRVYTEHLEDLVNKKTEQLKTSERLAAIGQVAGMVGHDIKSPLQAIINELFFAREAATESLETKGASEMLQSVEAIEQQVDYISKVLTDLQEYSKPIVPVLGEVNICDAIAETINALKVPNNIETNIKCASETFMLDRTLLRRALTNLVNNSIQAMPAGGKLEIEVQKKESSVTITIADTGKGIAEEMKDKLFTPLFTTKAKGQGFGLAAVKRIMDALGGQVTFESEEGKGTTFRLEFYRPTT